MLSLFRGSLVSDYTRYVSGRRGIPEEGLVRKRRAAGERVAYSWLPSGVQGTCTRLPHWTFHSIVPGCLSGVRNFPRFLLPALL